MNWGRTSAAAVTKAGASQGGSLPANRANPRRNGTAKPALLPRSIMAITGRAATPSSTSDTGAKADRRHVHASHTAGAAVASSSRATYT